MGNRGAFSPLFGKTGGIPIENRFYSTIGILGNIKIIQCDKFKNNPTTTYSNTMNTTYFSYSKENGRIEHIYYFRNHKLKKSIDITHGKPHAHYWNISVIGRKRHDKRNIFELSDKDKRLVELALKYNKDKNGTKDN